MRTHTLLLTALLVLPLPRAHADTFLLEDGRRIVGEKDGEYRTPSRVQYVRVKTLFGSVSFPKSDLEKTVRAGRPRGALKVEQIVVTTLKGAVEKLVPGAETWQRISPRTREAGTADAPRSNTPDSIVAPGDTLRTGEDGEADLDIGWGVVHVASGSELVFATDGEASIRLTRGRAGARLPDLPRRGEFRVETPQASMGVRGTTLVVSVSGATSRVAVEEGEVRIAELAVRGGAAARAPTDEPPAPTEISPGERSVFERLRRTYAIPRLDRVEVPAGEFGFGPRPGDSGQMVERVRVPVHMNAFAIGRTEVTSAQLRVFLDFMETHDDHTFCHPGEPADHEHRAFGADDGRELDRYLVERRELFDGDDQPATGVDFFTAYAFAAWAGGRLPSEVEWVYAAEGGSDDRYPWGNSARDALDHAWLAENAADERPVTPSPNEEASLVDAGVRTHPVGTRRPNGFGLHDMIGNVREHVDGGWPADPAVRPLDGSPRSPPPVPELRDGMEMSYGGSVSLRVDDPTLWTMRVDGKHKHTWDVGFRVCW